MSEAVTLTIEPHPTTAHLGMLTARWRSNKTGQHHALADAILLTWNPEVLSMFLIDFGKALRAKYRETNAAPTRTEGKA